MFPVSVCGLFPRAWQLCFTSYLKMLGTIKLSPRGDISLGFWHLTTGATSLLAGGLTQLANMHLALTEAADGQRKLMLQIGLNREGRKLLPRLQVELLTISPLVPFRTSLKIILQESLRQKTYDEVEGYRSNTLLSSNWCRPTTQNVIKYRHDHF